MVEGDIPTTLVHAGRRNRIMRQVICLNISVGLSSIEFYSIAPYGDLVVGYYREDGNPVRFVFKRDINECISTIVLLSRDKGIVCATCFERDHEDGNSPVTS